MDGVETACAQDAPRHRLHLHKHLVHCWAHLKLGINKRAEYAETFALSVLVVDDSKLFLGNTEGHAVGLTPYVNGSLDFEDILLDDVVIGVFLISLCDNQVIGKFLLKALMGLRCCVDILKEEVP